MMYHKCEWCSEFKKCDAVDDPEGSWTWTCQDCRLEQIRDWRTEQYKAGKPNSLKDWYVTMDIPFPYRRAT